MNPSIGMVVFTGVEGNSEPEKRLNRALEANTIDILRKTHSLEPVDVRILVTNSDRLKKDCESSYPELNVIQSEEDFDFGDTLYGVIDSYGCDRMLYLGGGSAPLFSEDDFRVIVEFLESNQEISISNNFYSTDLIGFSPASRLLDLKSPERDNELGWLTRDAGMTPFELGRNAKTQLDMDTPIDLLPLKLSDEVNGELESYLGSLSWGNTRIRGALKQFTDEDSRLVLFGRVGAETFSYLERNSACHVNLYSEGRGDYSGTKGGSNPSIAGDLVENKGPEELVEFLSGLGTGVFFDTRVLFNYLNEWPEAKDRFYSDLLEPDEVETPYLEELTRAALESPNPVVLGGHSILSGSLFLLTDVSWKKTDPKSANVRPKRLKL
ncbi:MAG: hypothetical protein ACOC86_05020 [Candidatus Bipolaricaulota bacterium]